MDRRHRRQGDLAAGRPERHLVLPAGRARHHAHREQPDGRPHGRPNSPQGPAEFLQEFARDRDTYPAFNTLADFLVDFLVGPDYGPKLTGTQRATAYQALLKIDNVTFHDGAPSSVGIPGAAFTYRVVGSHP